MRDTAIAAARPSFASSVPGQAALKEFDAELARIADLRDGFATGNGATMSGAAFDTSLKSLLGPSNAPPDDNAFVWALANPDVAAAVVASNSAILACSADGPPSVIGTRVAAAVASSPGMREKVKGLVTTIVAAARAGDATPLVSLWVVPDCESVVILPSGQRFTRDQLPEVFAKNSALISKRETMLSTCATTLGTGDVKVVSVPADASLFAVGSCEMMRLSDPSIVVDVGGKRHKIKIEGLSALGDQFVVSDVPRCE